MADNRLALDAGWDEELLKLELESLKEMDFDLDLTGFDNIEIDESDFFDEIAEQSLNKGEEVNTNDFDDENFECTCPKCGFKFNR